MRVEHSELADRTFRPRSVLITGGAVRVGAELVRAFAAAGSRVTVHCRNSAAAAGALIASLPGEGHRVITADFADPAAVESLFDRLDGTVDCLVNNASRYGRRTPASQESAAERRAYFEVNYFAPLALMRRFAAQPELTEGAIVNLLDQEVTQPTPAGGAYAQSRRALRDATLEWARELAPRIRVNAVAPGPVLPPVWLPGGRMEKTLRSVPLGRPVDPADLAAAVRFLAGNRSITGAVLCVDGGQHLNGI